MNYVLGVYRKYAAFYGRARRTEYWAFTAFFILVQTIAMMMFEVGQGAIQIIGSLIFIIFVLGSLVPAIAVGIRRLHDSNRTGYWILISFIPLIGGLVLLVFSLLPGTKGANRYGQDPKGLTDDSAPVVA